MLEKNIKTQLVNLYITISIGGFLLSEYYDTQRSVRKNKDVLHLCFQFNYKLHSPDTLKLETLLGISNLESKLKP